MNTHKHNTRRTSLTRTAAIAIATGITLTTVPAIAGEGGGVHPAL